MMTAPPTLGAGVGKSPREETAGDGVERFRVRYGDLIAADDERDRWEDGSGRWSKRARIITVRYHVGRGALPRERFSPVALSRRTLRHSNE
jgi:hypothetical protein